MKKKISLTISIIFVSLIIAGCLDKVREEPEKSYNTNGISDTEIIIGSSSPLTGDAGVLGTQYIHGSLALINETNAQGGFTAGRSGSYSMMTSMTL